MPDLVLGTPEAKGQLFKGYYRMLCRDYGPPFLLKGGYMLIALVQTILAIEADKLGAEGDKAHDSGKDVN